MEAYLLGKEAIDALDGLDKTHFLNDQAKRNNKSLGDLTGISGFGFHLIEVPPGCAASEYHKHYYEDECVYVLEGEAKATIGCEEYTVGAGDFIGYRAGGKAHSLMNCGDSVLKCIVVGQRLDHDVGDYPRLKKRLYRNAGMPWNLVDMDNIEKPTAGRKN